MTNEEILSAHPGCKNLSVTAVNLMLCHYYIGKLAELKLISCPPTITPKGFDLSMDIIERGWKLDKESLLEIIPKITNISYPPFVNGMAETIVEIHEKGFDSVKEKLEEFTEQNDERSN